jgi:hypothetical protein
MGLHAVPDYSAAAMRTGGRKRLNRTLKRIESMGHALHYDLECLVVVISASFTNRHNYSSLQKYSDNPLSRHFAVVVRG